jgi:DNA-binding GntR family transcriptional regulator
MPTENQPEASTYDRVKQMILSGEIGLGDPLIERSLAAKIGVSRTPIRESIFMLEREGLVRVVEGKGAFVASYTIEDMIEIYHVREGLEPIAARLSCPHIADDDLKRAEEQLHHLNSRPTLRAENPTEWMRIGREFHSMFIRASHNNRLIQTIEGFQDQIDLARGLGRLVAVSDSDSAINEHMDILNALKARDPAGAEAAVRRHLQNGLRHRLERFSLGRGPILREQPAGHNSTDDK